MSLSTAFAVRRSAPSRRRSCAGTAIPRTDYVGLSERRVKLLAAAFSRNLPHAAALRGKAHDVARAKREVSEALRGKRGFHELGETARAILSALDRYEGDDRGFARWLSAYAAGARKAARAGLTRSAAELSAAADEFAAGSWEIGENYAAQRVEADETELTEAERNLLRAVSRLNAATGGDLRVKFFDGAYTDANGYIDGNEIHLNRNGADALLKAFGHEFTHWLEKSEGYGAARDYVLAPGGACERIFMARTGRSVAGHRAFVKSLYERRLGETLDAERVESEVAADVCGTVLFADDFESIFEIRRENKGFFSALLGFLKRLLRAVSGTKVERSVSEAVELYRKAAFEARTAEKRRTEKPEFDEAEVAELAEKLKSLGVESASPRGDRGQETGSSAMSNVESRIANKGKGDAADNGDAERAKEAQGGSDKSVTSVH